MTWSDRLSWGLRLSLAGLFMTAGLLKIPDVAGFAEAVAAYGLLPAWLTLPAAAYLPWLELTAGLALLLPHWHRAAGVVLMGMMLSFTAALASAHVRGLNLDCGCFGPDESAGYAWQLIRNTAILASLAALLILGRGRPSLKPAPDRDSGPTGEGRGPASFQLGLPPKP